MANPSSEPWLTDKARTALLVFAASLLATVAVRRGYIVHRRLRQREEILPASPQPGDILLFYRPARKRDYLIRWFTDSPFYHSALYAGNGIVIEARPNGVHRNSLVGREKNFVVLSAPGGPDEGRRALEWAETQIGAGYDRMDMAVILLERIFQNWHINYTPFGKYTCAEFIATAYYHAGLRLFPERSLDGVDPGDFARFLPLPVVQAAG